MSAPAGKGNKAAGWGSFLSNAVSGLESRLDNILAEEEGGAGRVKAIQDARREAAAKVAQKAGQDGMFVDTRLVLRVSDSLQTPEHLRDQGQMADYRNVWQRQSTRAPTLQEQAAEHQSRRKQRQVKAPH